MPTFTGKSFISTWRIGVLQPPPDYICHGLWHHRMLGVGRDPVQTFSVQLNGNTFWPKWTDPTQQCSVNIASKPILELVMCPGTPPSLIYVHRYIIKFTESILCHSEIAEHLLFPGPLGLINVLEELAQRD